MRLKILSGLIFLICPFISIYAQTSAQGNWLIYLGSQSFHKKWNWHNEIQYRNYNVLGDLEQLLLRTGIGYNLSENNNNVLAGYAFIHTERYASGNPPKIGSNEHRLYQQYIYRHALKRIFIQHRYRFEQRFLADDFKLRLRYFLAVNIPINHAVLSKDTWYLSAYNEVFIQPKSTAFDRDRIYGALGYVINKSVRLELGYMTQLLESPNKNRSQWQLLFFNNIPISKL